jgi:dUTP pyrophosphatase
MTDFVRLNPCVLLIAIQDPELRNIYKSHIEKHNAGVIDGDAFPNSGFDLFIPENVLFDQTAMTKMVGLGVKCEMIRRENNRTVTLPFFMFPRSSMSKTPLMLANHTGIIDSGYRGELIAALRNLSGSPYEVVASTRLLQICLPSLDAFTVEIVEEEVLSTTARGSGGFGSTGIVG